MAPIRTRVTACLDSRRPLETNSPSPAPKISLSSSGMSTSEAGSGLPRPASPAPPHPAKARQLAAITSSGPRRFLTEKTRMRHARAIWCTHSAATLLAGMHRPARSRAFARHGVASRTLALDLAPARWQRRRRFGAPAGDPRASGRGAAGPRRWLPRLVAVLGRRRDGGQRDREARNQVSPGCACRSATC